MLTKKLIWLVAASVAITVLAPVSPVLGRPPPVPLTTLDAGHGGSDPGAINCTHSFAGHDCVHESDINLDMATRASRFLRRWGLEVRMTRTRDTEVNRPASDLRTWNEVRRDDYDFYRDGAIDQRDELQARVNIANCATVHESCERDNPKQADAFVSVHNNACGDCGAEGTTTYYFRDRSLRLAELVQEEVTERVDTTSRGLGTARFYVITWTRMPAALLEAGFVDNPQEVKRLLRARFRRRVGLGVASGVARYLCTPKGTRHDDKIEGTDGPDVLCGLRGDDIIRGRGGRDVILGGGGADRLFGNGDDRLAGNRGNDLIDGGNATDACTEGQGTDKKRACEGVR